MITQIPAVRRAVGRTFMGLAPDSCFFSSKGRVPSERRTVQQGQKMTRERTVQQVYRACILLTLSCIGYCVTPTIAHLEIVFPYRFQLHYAPAWFGAIVLPPGRLTAEVQYAGDACETLLGSYAVRQKIALVDRGKCSFVQKVRNSVEDICSCV